MSLPERPAASSPRREQRQRSFRESYHRRRDDLESGGHAAEQHAYGSGPGSPTATEQDPITGGPQSPGLGRKRSLVRPERRRVDRDDPNYHYRQHAANMTTYPSTTGNVPIAEDNGEEETSSASTEAKSLYKPEQEGNAPSDYDERRRQHHHRSQQPPPHHHHDRSGAAADRGPARGKSQKKLTRSKLSRSARAEEKRRQDLEPIKPPTLWNVYCGMITFWCPDFILKCMGMPAKEQRRAWREKMGLISCILLIATFVGFLTFGFTPAQTISG